MQKSPRYGGDDLTLASVPEGAEVKVAADRKGYGFAIVDTTDRCRSGVFSNQEGIIYTGQALQQPVWARPAPCYGTTLGHARSQIGLSRRRLKDARTGVRGQGNQHRGEPIAALRRPDQETGHVLRAHRAA